MSLTLMVAEGPETGTGVRRESGSVVKGCHRSLGLHLPVVWGLVPVANGRTGRDRPLAGLLGRAAEVAWPGGQCLLPLWMPCFDGWRGGPATQITLQGPRQWSVSLLTPRWAMS